MGLCLSIDQEERKARARSDEIDRRLQTSGNEETHVIKILLLGKWTRCKHIHVHRWATDQGIATPRVEAEYWAEYTADTVVTAWPPTLLGL